MTDLAIVIPAYKINFFEKAIASLHRQTCQDFILYVIVDGNNEDFEQILQRFQFSNKPFFYRFEDNIGRTDLVKAWTRSLSFLQNEKWTWLFSDDDEMDPECVERFYQKVMETNGVYDLYRFNTERINEESKIISKRSNHPAIESSENFLKRRLKYLTSNFISEYIFRRSRFDETGGFVSFPAAWASDDATWIRLGLKTGICTIEGPIIRWRQSTQNISGAKNNPVVQRQKKEASILFLNWVYNLSKKYDFKIKTSDLLGWLLVMMKVIGYRRGSFSFPSVLPRLDTFRFSTILTNIRFCYKWFADPDPDWL